MKLTPEQFLQEEIEKGRCFENPRFVELAKNTVLQLLQFREYKIIDYGAGTGVYANELMNQGFDVVAQDIWESHIYYMKERYPGLEVKKDPVKSDFMIFIEVAEHMTDQEIIKVISIIDPDFILFSSTSKERDSDEEWGHINLKEQSVWDIFWKEQGYNKIKDLNKPTSWTKLYQRI